MANLASTARRKRTRTRTERRWTEREKRRRRRRPTSAASCRPPQTPLMVRGFFQGCGSIRILIGSGFNRVSGSGSGSVFGIRFRIQEGKNDPQKKKKLRNFMFWSAGCSLLRAVGFFCNLDVLYGGQGVGKFLVFFQKSLIIFSALQFSQF